MSRTILKKISPFFGLFLFIIALLVLYHELRVYHLHEIISDIRGVSRDRLIIALLLTILSYSILTGYDILALRYVKHPLSYLKIALASFTGYAFSNNVGLSMVAGSSVRYRLYSSWGLTALEITKVVVFCVITLWLGFFTIGGVAFIVEPLILPSQLHLPFHSVHVIGWIFIVIATLFVVWTFTTKKPLNIRTWEFPIPAPGLVIAQIAIASLDWIVAGSILYVLLPRAQGISFAAFLSIFLLAQTAGLVSQVPGGLGVFEAMILLLLANTYSASQILGSLLAFRGIYYILPLLIASILLGYQEFLQKRETIKKIGSVFSGSLSTLIPPIFAFTTFLGGVVLLLSGVLPATRWRIIWLSDFLPLPIMELSHLLGSIIGLMLLFLARSIQRRMDTAYIFTIILLSAGILFSLLKGLDYEEATILSSMLVALLPCRRYFYRKGSLISERYSPGWVAAILTVLFSSIWLGFFSLKHVEYSNSLWWSFTLHGDAPRFLRAMVGVLSVISVFLIMRLLRPKQPKLTQTGYEDLDTILTIVQNSDQAYANLAFLGDKTFIFNEKRDAFIMYGVEGRSWIAMGDPIGPGEEWPELIWQYRELCDRYDGWPIFYEVRPGTLHIYLDIGLTSLKLGEEAWVSLDTFSLEGSARKGLRYTFHKLEREGCIFEVIPPEQVHRYMTEFRTISDEWLKEKNTREKGFSLGFFKEEYLRRFPFGIVRKEDEILGFASMWITTNQKEFSIDLMRYRQDAPSGLMEFLLTQLMLWGKQQGYEWFNLGMAPFSGFQEHNLAPLWNRIGAFIFHHGEHFYNLQGLRAYKEKFGPVWKPKYLVSPGGFSLPRILANITTLISGGMKGVVTK